MRRPLLVRFAARSLVLVAAALALSIALEAWLGEALIASALSLFLVAPLAFLLTYRLVTPMISLFRALEGTVGSYRDGDFNFSLSWPRRDEVRDLVDAHNALGKTLREQRLALVERELLLDTMVQHTPVAMVLVDPAQRVVYANVAARKLLAGGRKLEGMALSSLLDRAHPALREAIERGGDGLFVARQGDQEAEEDDDSYHLARRSFRLNGRVHELFLLRRLTAELRRQEVATWKKVIRVISHELNNSLAPIVSLTRSSSELARQGRAEQLGRALATIEERARHLEHFIRGYARFAKLPAPQLANVAWPEMVERLQTQIDFRVAGPICERPAHIDAAQIEQALLNLLKNAHESGSAAEDVTLSIREAAGETRVEVADRGSGMSDAMLESALLPFYSTKRDGTGLGLALAREIAEAHGGRMALCRRDGGGLAVTLTLPAR